MRPYAYAVWQHAVRWKCTAIIITLVQQSWETSRSFRRRPAKHWRHHRRWLLPAVTAGLPGIPQVPRCKGRRLHRTSRPSGGTQTQNWEQLVIRQAQDLTVDDVQHCQQQAMRHRCNWQTPVIIIIIIKAMRLTWHKCKSTARPRYNTRG